MPDDFKTEAEFTEADWLQRARDPHFRPRSLVADAEPAESDPAKKTTEQFLTELQERR